MGQRDIVVFLDKQEEDRWFTAKQISQAINMGEGSTNIALKKLRRFGMVTYTRSLNGTEKMYYQKKRWGRGGQDG